MKFDLYQLCDEKLNVGTIRAITNETFKKEIKDIVLKLKNKIKFKDISQALGIDYTTLWDYLNRRTYIPLGVLKKLELLSNKILHENIRELVCGQGKIKINLPKEISIDLAKILGTIIADGHLRIRKASKRRGHHYELVIREEYESNVLAFSKWFSKVFKFDLKPKKEKNHYYIYLSNKIIVLFFSSIMGLPLGKKVDKISVPLYFENLNIKLKKALLQGIFMFDGGVDYCTGYVSLVSRSQNLIKSVNNILNEINLKPDYISKYPDKYGRHKIIFRKHLKLNRCLELFEKDTEKWYRLREHMFGLQNKTKNLNKLYSELDKYYPRKRKSSMTFSDIIKVVKDLNKEASFKNISKNIKKEKTTTYAYLNKLTRWKILKSKRRGLEKIWELNEIFYFPRRQK